MPNPKKASDEETHTLYLKLSHTDLLAGTDFHERSMCSCARLGSFRLSYLFISLFISSETILDALQPQLHFFLGAGLGDPHSSFVELS